MGVPSILASVCKPQEGCVTVCWLSLVRIQLVVRGLVVGLGVRLRFFIGHQVSWEMAL